MHSSLRRALIESRSGAAAVALLIAWGAMNLCYALQGPAQHLLVFIGTAIAILDIPSPPTSFEIRVVLLHSTYFLVLSLTEFGIAWFLSKVVYGAGPLAVLRTTRNELKGNRK